MKNNIKFLVLSSIAIAIIITAIITTPTTQEYHTLEHIIDPEVVENDPQLKETMDLNNQAMENMTTFITKLLNHQPIQVSNYEPKKMEWRTIEVTGHDDKSVPLLNKDAHYNSVNEMFLNISPYDLFDMVYIEEHMGSEYKSTAIQLIEWANEDKDIEYLKCICQLIISDLNEIDTDKHLSNIIEFVSIIEGIEI